MKKIRAILILLLTFSIFSCEEKISEKDLSDYKTVMDVRLGHLGNAIIIQGRLLDAFNLSNERADEDHFKEAEELVKGNLELFGRPDELKEIKKLLKDEKYFASPLSNLVFVEPYGYAIVHG